MLKLSNKRDLLAVCQVSKHLYQETFPLLYEALPVILRSDLSIPDSLSLSLKKWEVAALIRDISFHSSSIDGFTRQCVHKNGRIDYLPDTKSSFDGDRGLLLDDVCKDLNKTLVGLVDGTLQRFR